MNKDMKVNFKQIEMLQLDGTMAPADLSQELAKAMYVSQEEKIARLGMRIFQGETELTDAEADIVRTYVAQQSWVVRDAIDRALSVARDQNPDK